LIAATAIVNGMAVVTRNERDFGRFAQLDVVNPWADTAGDRLASIRGCPHTGSAHTELGQRAPSCGSGQER